MNGTALEKYIAGEPVEWSEFPTYEERLALYHVVNADTGYHVDMEYVGWVDWMNTVHYPNGEFRRPR